jgi:two-component system sensor histidine kinase PilS (NtrC family)
VNAPKASTAPGSQPGAPWRTLEYLSLTRLLATGALLLTALALGDTATSVYGVRTPSGVLQVLALVYFGSAALVGAAAFYWHQHFGVQLTVQLALDMLLATALMTMTGGVGSGLVVAYLLPLAAAALLLSTSGALFLCALAAIAVLFDALLRSWQGGGAESQVFQAGLYGAALFGITGLLRLLSARIDTNEQLARARGLDLENQLEINRLVIAQMEQGVLVVDAAAQVRAANRAVRGLLGIDADDALVGCRLHDLPHASALTLAFERWLHAERSAQAWSDTHDAQAALAQSETELAVNQALIRVRFARPPSNRVQDYVVFLEDLHAIEERAQQMKLASMGRLTAAIAHEIRNPLAAIRHAGQLLGEEAPSAGMRRLAAIVGENSLRLDRLVDDVLRVARREGPVGETIALDRFITHWVEEFSRDRDRQGWKLRASVAAGLSARFEQSHLRQVLFNLIDNALRYASDRAGSIEIVGEADAIDPGRTRLWVFDDGPGIPEAARSSLFEPFFTTHPRGTGLGLYIAREFCVANRAELTYTVRRQPGGGVRAGFLLRFAVLPAAEAAEDAGFLDTIPFR